MKEYVLKKVSDEQALQGKVWDRIEKAEIDVYPWDVNGYRPVAFAQAFYTGSRLHVRMTAMEDMVSAVNVDRDSPVCNDSCLEFFFNPEPQVGQAYLNFEINPIGTFLLETGLTGQRTFLPNVPDQLLSVWHSHQSPGVNQKTDGSWSISFSIPHDLIKAHYPHYQAISGGRIAGNFYKCGDLTAFPHHGCWNPVNTDAPNFHRPDCFGLLIFE